MTDVPVEWHVVYLPNRDQEWSEKLDEYEVTLYDVYLLDPTESNPGNWVAYPLAREWVASDYTVLDGGTDPFLTETAQDFLGMWSYSSPPGERCDEAVRLAPTLEPMHPGVSHFEHYPDTPFILSLAYLFLYHGVMDPELGNAEEMLKFLHRPSFEDGCRAWML